MISHVSTWWRSTMALEYVLKFSKNKSIESWSICLFFKRKSNNNLYINMKIFTIPIAWKCVLFEALKWDHLLFEKIVHRILRDYQVELFEMWFLFFLNQIIIYQIIFKKNFNLMILTIYCEFQLRLSTNKQIELIVHLIGIILLSLLIKRVAMVIIKWLTLDFLVQKCIVWFDKVEKSD